MKYYVIAVITSLSLIWSACGNGDHDQQDMDIEQEMAEAQQADGFSTPEDFRSELESALMVYLEVVDALVETNASDAAVYADEFGEALTEIETGNLDQSAAMFWEEYSDRIEAHSSALQQHDDVEDQRYEFEYISEALIEVVKSMGPLDMTLYQQRCPMVRDGEGDWLSSHEEIRNPYHGDRMMNCGSTVEQI